MSSAACARAASTLTAVVDRLASTRAVLQRQQQVPRDDFDGLAATAFRVHVAGSAQVVADLASRVALLAAGLAELGRELATVEHARREASSAPPDRAAALRARAEAAEQQAQQEWRRAVERFDGSATTTGSPASPAPRSPTAAMPHQQAPGAAAPPGGAPAPSPPPAPATPPAGPLTSALVTPLDAELVAPGWHDLPQTTPESPGPTATTACGTPEEVHDARG